jgi:dihydroorotate dehydrogenase
MRDLSWPLLRTGLFALSPERAHALTLAALARGPRWPARATAPELAQRIWRLDFPTPLGMAAGFDKNAEVPDALLNLGFGHVEIGTVTPRPQAGNPQPRLFRLTQDRALINRLGFNNEGHAAVVERLKRRGGARADSLGIVGVNLGANKDSVDRAADYVAGIGAFAQIADYMTINVSSPNTPGLRDLQAPAALEQLLAAIMRARAELVSRGQPRRPVVVKLAPDLADDDVPDIAAVILASGADGIAVSNTTLTRTGLRDALAGTQAGGLSGAPLFALSTRLLAKIHRLTAGKVPLIGIGGIASADDAIAKLEAGASLLQLYTGLLYQGPTLISTIHRGIADTLRRDRVTLAELTGRRAAQWAR